MTVSSVSSTDQNSVIQQMLASLQSTLTGAVDAFDSADSTGSSGASSTGSATSAGSPPPPPPPKPDGAGSDLFSSDTLAGLMQAQESPAQNAATTLIAGADTDGSGTLSLAEIEQALDGASSTPASGSGSSTTAASSTDASAAASSALQAEFAKLDTNGDGQLDQGELAAGLQQMQQGGHAHHGHGHHHHAYQAAAASTTDATTTAATTSTGATTGATTATDVTA